MAEVGDGDSGRIRIEDAIRDAPEMSDYAKDDANSVNNVAVNANNDVVNANNDAVKANNDADIANSDAVRDADRDANNDADRELNNDACRDAIKSSISVLYTNAQSLVNKICEMRAVVAMNNPDILIVTETWTNESISNEYLGIDGYDIIERKDRNDTDKGRGGGILMYVKKVLYSWKIECETEFNQCGMIGIKRNSRDLRVAAVYRSPNSSKPNDDELCKWIEKMNGQYIIIGDFNFPDIRWKTGCSGAKGRQFLETMADKFLTQHVETATHNSGNILDLVISSEEDLVRDVELIGNIGKSDHAMLMCKIDTEVVRSKRASMGPNFYRANVDAMRLAMSKDWTRMLDGGVNDMWSLIKESLETVIALYVPLKKKRQKDEPKWLDAEMRRKIVEKKRAWSEWKRTGRTSDKLKYKETERQSKKMIRNKKNALERNIAKNSKTNPKMYFSYVNSSKRNRSRIGPLKNDDGDFIIQPREQAQAFSKFFASVFTCSDGDPPSKTAINGNAWLNDIEVTEERVRELIDGMKENSAPGPDGFPPVLLKTLRDEIARPIAILFKKSLDDGQIPDEWREAEITPIHKKGSKADPGNYRGVSFTSVVGKMMERMVKNEISKHVENGALMSKTQHGFRSGKSVLTNLIEFLNQTTKWCDEGYCFDVIYLDFSKAFDVVCHKRLMVKLRAIGIGGKVIRWLEDWIANRKQRVKIEGEFSDWVSVLSSVLQGSVLGGILFNIFVDDIDEAIKDLLTLICKFADDTKLAKIIKSIQDAIQMQKNLDDLSRWAEKWKMGFNAKKCKVIHYGKNNIRYDYKLDGCVIESVSEEKDLGVWMQADLKPTKQCKMAAQTANWALGQLMKTFHYRKASCLVPLYTTFVRPKLEHAVGAWSPWLEGDKETLERVQKRMIRNISDKRGETYEQRLRSVGLTTLEERRERGDMIEAFKTINGFNKVDRASWFDFRDSANTRATRSTVSVVGEEQQDRNDVLFMGNVRLESRKNFFTVRVIAKWNKIPDAVKGQRTINAFKNKYDEWKETVRRQRQLQT